MKAFVILPVIAALATPAQAATYYLSTAPLASDANPGTSPAAAWRSIAKLNTANLQPGDSVLFERGGIYRGQIDARPGTAGNPVYYGAYGNGARPVISGAAQVQGTGWSVYQGGIYVKTGVLMPAMGAAEPPNLFVNGRLMLPARYPGSGLLQAGEVFGQNPGSNCCEYSYGLQDGFLPAVFPNPTDLEGAHLTGYSPYGVSTRLVTGYDPAAGTLQFDTLRGIGFINRRWYFLSRKLNFLDAPGEWYYDDATKKLYCWKPDGTPFTTADTIEYSYHKFGISDWQVPYIVVEGLEFRYQQIAGIYIIRSTGVRIADNRFYQSKYGIHGWGSSTTALEGTVVENNVFDDIHRVAINLNNYVNGARLLDNRLHNIGRVDALMQSGQPDQWSAYGYWEYGTGIQLNATNSLVARNRIDSTGRQAIAAGGGPGVHILNNIIDCPCLNYNDCGGIMPLGNSRVEGNIIRDSYGYFSAEEYTGEGARGIYPDFRTADTIRGNTIAGTVMGIGLTNSKNEIIEENIVYDCTLAAFRMNRKNAGQLNNRVVGNTFFGLPDALSAVLWDNQVPGPDDNSVFDSNRYWHPYLYFPLVKYRPDGSLPADTWYDLGQWQTLGQDAGAESESVFKNQPWRLADTLGPTLLQNGGFDAGLSGWSNTGNMAVATTPGQLDGPCARITYNGTYAGTFFQNDLSGFAAGQLYLVRFSLQGSLNTHGEPIQVRLVETNDTDQEHFYRVFKIQTERREYWSVFEARNAEALDLRFMAPNGTYFLDNIDILPVAADWLDPRQVFPIFINETADPMSIGLPPCAYLDLDGNPVAGSLNLPPFSSQILVLENDSCLLSPPAATQMAPATEPGLRVYPNPAGPQIRVQFTAPRTGPVSLSILDAAGRQAAVLVDTQLAAGDYELAFSISFLKPGAYFVQLKAGEKVVVRKIAAGF